ncbi:MAG: acetate/propionate family kinase, partial [Weissella cibaria]
RYVAERAADMMGKPLSELKLITLHLGAGASITAIKDGKSFDTSMGFTPLAGLMMATRSGDVDPSLIYYIQEREGLSNAEMLRILNNKSGLLGVSTLSSDMRDVEEVADTNEHAKLALDMFLNRVVRYLGQYTFEMGGVDGIVFTAGIGENAANVREDIIARLKFLGIEMDKEANNVRGVERIISTPESSATVLLVPTNEELEIARDVERLKAQAGK